MRLGKPSGVGYALWYVFCWCSAAPSLGGAQDHRYRWDSGQPELMEAPSPYQEWGWGAVPSILWLYDL